jgi:hypothetical protein
MGDGIRVFSMYGLSGELTLVLIATWWLQKLGEKMAVSKKATQKSNMEKSNLRKQNELEVRKQYQIKISNRFAAFGNLSDSEG